MLKTLIDFIKLVINTLQNNLISFIIKNCTYEILSLNFVWDSKYPQ